MAFGAFAIESGSGSLMMDSNGILTPSGGTFILSSSNPVTTFQVTVDNTKDPTVCGTFGFTLSWGAAPAALTDGATGPPMSLTNVLVSEPTLLPVPTTLPQTLTTANLPITLTFQGDLGASFPQASGLYTSPVFTLDLTQDAATTSLNSTATATILAPITLMETVTMNFGTVAGGANPGTVIMDTLGARSVTGDAQALIVGPGAAGEFQITGEAGFAYGLVITEPAVLASGGQTMTADTFTNNSLGALPGSGVELFQVGATLHLNAAQPGGNYSTANPGGSTYQVTVNYN